MKILNQKDLHPSLRIPTTVKIVAKNLYSISPSLGTRLSAKIFRTPVNFKRPQREVYMYKSAQKMNQSVASINKKIEVLSYGYSQKKVLLIHGWAGRSTQLFAFADKLLEKGFMVISFDGPAHGNSSGRSTNMIEFIEAVKELDRVYGPFKSVIGHSFGAMTALNSAADFLSVDSIVTIGAADRVSDIMQRFTNSLTMDLSAGKRLQQFAERKWRVAVDEFAADVVAQKISQPVLVVHDTKDGDVPVSCAYRIRQSLQNGQLLISEGLGHTKILRNEGVVNKVVDFIIENS